MSDLLNIEVAYALPERQTVLCIRVAPETSVLAAIEQSGILQKHPEARILINTMHEEIWILKRLTKASISGPY